MRQRGTCLVLAWCGVDIANFDVKLQVMCDVYNSHKKLDFYVSWKLRIVGSRYGYKAVS